MLNSSNLKKFSEWTPSSIFYGRFEVEKISESKVKITVWDSEDNKKEAVEDEFDIPKSVDPLNKKLNSNKDEDIIKYLKDIRLKHLWDAIILYKYHESYQFNDEWNHLFNTINLKSKINLNNISSNDDKRNDLNPDSPSFIPSNDLSIPQLNADSPAFEPPEDLFDFSSSSHEGYVKYSNTTTSTTTNNHMNQYHYFDDSEYDEEDDIDMVDDYINPCEICGKIPTIQGTGLCDDCCFNPKSTIQ